MTNHESLLRKMENKHRLNMLELDALHDRLRSEMAAKHGPDKIRAFEESVKDGDGIGHVVGKWKNN